MSFGSTWDELQQPVEAVVAVIDPGNEFSVGLSAMQLRNLGLERQNELDVEDVAEMVHRNLQGLVDTNPYPPLRIESGVGSASAAVYNAFGHLSTGQSDGIRISQALSERLEIQPGDTVKLTT